MPTKITPVNPVLASSFHSSPFLGRVTEFWRSNSLVSMSTLDLVLLGAFELISLIVVARM